MLVVPTHQDDLYTRLWCVYEIFAATRLWDVPVDLARSLAKAGGVSSSQAKCSSDEDRRQIRKEIEDNGGYDVVDKAVKAVTRQSQVRLVLESVRSVPVLIILIVGGIRVLGLHAYTALSAALGIFLCFVTVLVAAAAMRVFEYSGIVHRRKFWKLIGFCVLCSLLSLLIFAPYGEFRKAWEEQGRSDLLRDDMITNVPVFFFITMCCTGCLLIQGLNFHDEARWGRDASIKWTTVAWFMGWSQWSIGLFIFVAAF